MKHLTSIALVLVLVVGCVAPAPTGDEIPLPELDQSRWPDAIRLSNGTAVVIVVPSLGRIMRYGLGDEDNVLWANPTPEAQSWPNPGGDKACPWPQEDWPLRIGRVWPPPKQCDAPMRAHVIANGTGVRMESDPLEGFGVRLVREIALEPHGTRVTIVTRIEPASAEPPPPELSAWSITQIPAGAKLYARLTHDGAVRGLAPAPWATTRPVSGAIVGVEMPTPRAGKIGFDADLLAAASGTMLFVQHDQTPAPTARSRGYRAGERAQFYIRPVVPGVKPPAPDYLELEFTSPREDLAANRFPELRLTWELFTSPRPWTDQSVAEFLATLQANSPAPAGVP